jgi:predicted membrane-bound spermidine synthase
VTLFNTDARAFFRRTSRQYDMVIFGFLDSQSLFSQMSNIRLDGYVYTRESFWEAFGLLRDSGLMSIAFSRRAKFGYWID